MQHFLKDHFFHKNSSIQKTKISIFTSCMTNIIKYEKITFQTVSVFFVMIDVLDALHAIIKS